MLLGSPAHVSGGLSSQGSQPVPLFCHPQYLGSHPPEHPHPQQRSTAAPMPQLMLQRKSPNWSPGYSWTGLITNKTYVGIAKRPTEQPRGPTESTGKKPFIPTVVTEPKLLLNSCWEYEDILSNMSAKQPLLCPSQPCL